MTTAFNTQTPDSSIGAKQIFLKWERLRLIYNGVLLGCYVVYVFMVPTAFWRLAVIIGIKVAITANLCFFAAPVVETFLNWRGVRSQFIPVVLLLGGLIVSLPLMFVYAGRYIPWRFELEARHAPLQFPDPSNLSSYGEADGTWTIQTLDGQEKTLSEFKGNVLFITFWTTGCSYCIAEMSGIQKLYASLKNEDIAFLLISNEDETTVRKFVDKNHYTVPVYVRGQDLPKVFQTRGIPATFILSRDGTVVFKYVGYASWDEASCVRFLRSLI